MYASLVCYAWEASYVYLMLLRVNCDRQISELLILCSLSTALLELRAMIFSYLDEIDRISERGYLPTLQDILRARKQTTTIIEHYFEFTEDVNSKILRLLGIDRKLTTLYR